jgi:hypothetical protein
MRPANFVDWAEGEDCADAFKNAHVCARLMHRVGGFDAPILRKRSFIEVNAPIDIVDERGLERLCLTVLAYVQRERLEDGSVVLDLEGLAELVEEDDESLRCSVNRDQEWFSLIDFAYLMHVIGVDAVDSLLRQYVDINGPCLAVRASDSKWLFFGLVTSQSE